MKYMGGKSMLLRVGLGELLIEEAQRADRFVDLFAGSAAVAHYVAEHVDVEVVAYDLQQYSRVLADAVLARTTALCPDDLQSWLLRASKVLESHPAVEIAASHSRDVSAQQVYSAREFSAQGCEGTVLSHYGGHYFSPLQSLAFDCLLDTLPTERQLRTVGLASVIQTASWAASSPGHTAQPFQPTPRLLPYLQQSWAKDVITACQERATDIACRHAIRLGRGVTNDGVSASANLGPNDLVFLDPPYSNVQYSRFYHVLEGIARGGWVKVNGAGRMPERSLRATSIFSCRKYAQDALLGLAVKLLGQGSTIILTLPDRVSSNGVDARALITQLEYRSAITVSSYPMRHSTLGGTLENSESSRPGRLIVNELAIVMRPH